MLSKKSLYPYEYINEWKRFDETALSKKEEFHNNVNMEDNTDVNYMHGKRVCKVFLVTNLGQYHDLCLISDTLLLADVFKNFRKMSSKIYQLDLVKLRSGLAWQAALKKVEVKLGLLTDIDMLLMVAKNY